MASLVEVRHKNAAQRGLFALENISQGKTILILPEDTVEKPDRYSIQVFPGVHLNCTDHPAGAINHSCRPNAAMWKWKIVAFSCLKSGDEVTIDYNRTEDQITNPFTCECGHCDGKKIDW